jgi:hypothetical protein
MSSKFRSTPGALLFDAYYSDEFGATNTDANTSDLDGNRAERVGFHKNKFTETATPSPGTALEFSKSYSEFNVYNKANPSFTIGLKVKQSDAPRDPEHDKHTIKLFFAQSVFDYASGLGGQPWKEPINLTILFAINFELNRHGLRSFFVNQSGLLGLIVVPGVEPKKGSPRWGIAVGDDQIDRMLQNAFHSTTTVPYRVRVLAGFSTGYNGLNQTLLNELVQLNEVRRIVFYDCLYELGCGSTAQAVAKLKSKAGSDLKIVVYKTSEAGNSFADPVRLAVLVKNPGLIDPLGVIENLFQQPTYISLVCFRSLEAAEHDGVITIPAPVKPAYDALKAVVPARGVMISNERCFKYIHGSLPTWAGVVLFEAWVKANQKVIDQFSKHLGSVNAKGTVRHILWGNHLPGWVGGDGEEKHDLLMPEFGWEYLPY